MNTVQRKTTSTAASFSTITSGGIEKSTTATTASRTSSGSYTTVSSKESSDRLQSKSMQTTAPVILQMPLQTPNRLSKPLQVKVFVGLGATREYVASVEVALLKRFCSNFEECSEKSAGGSSILLERADRQTIGWFLRWLSRGQTDCIEPDDDDQDERMRVCLARLYVFQKLGVILPSGKPEDVLMEEIEKLVKRMPKLLSTHAKYVYEHFSDKRSVDYGQVFAALISKATLNGSLQGMKDKTFWRSPPFVLFERNLKAHHLSEEILARVQRIQTNSCIPTRLLEFLLRFSTQGDQLRVTLASDLVRLEQSQSVADTKAHYGDTLSNTGFDMDINAARIAWVDAHQTPAKAERFSAKPRGGNQSRKTDTNKTERIAFVAPLSAQDQEQGAGSNRLGDKFTTAVRRLHREGSSMKRQPKQQQPRAGQPEPEVDHTRSVEEASRASIPKKRYPEEPRSVTPAKQRPSTMRLPLQAKGSTSQRQGTPPFPLGAPVMNGSTPSAGQPSKRRIVIRLPPPPATSEEPSKQKSNGERHSALGTTANLESADKAGVPSGEDSRPLNGAGQQTKANSSAETAIPKVVSPRMSPIIPAIPLAFEVEKR